MQLRSKRRDQDPEKDRPLTPHLSCRWREALMWLKCGLSPNYAACEFRWRPTWPQKAASMQTLPAIQPHAAKLRLRTQVRGSRRRAHVRDVCDLKAAAKMLQLRGQPHCKLSRLQEVEGGKGGRCKARASGARPQGCRLLTPAGPQIGPS
jgi:hypothetical protein